MGFAGKPAVAVLVVLSDIIRATLMLAEFQMVSGIACAKPTTRKGRFKKYNRKSV